MKRQIDVPKSKTFDIQIHYLCMLIRVRRKYKILKFIPLRNVYIRYNIAVINYFYGDTFCG